MVRHDSVDDILSSALRHRASHAIDAGRMRALGEHCLQSGGVALAADIGVMVDCRLSARTPMRVMTGLAGQCILALEKATGSPEPVGGAADNLKLVPEPSAGRMIERQHEGSEGFDGREGERPAIKSPDQSGNRRTGRLKMTLHAEIHAQLRTEPGGIDDTGANLLAAGAGGLSGTNVIAAGAMAALAVDAGRKVAAKDGLAARSLVPGWNTRVSVMAKKAFIGNQPPGDRVRRIKPGAHRPVAALFRIPAERELDECSARGAMQIRAGMVA